MNDSQLAYDRIVRPLESRLIRSIWRIVPRAQDAEDALQNALLTIWKRWDRVVAHGCPEALVLKIGIDAAYDVARRRLRERTWLKGESATEGLSDPAPTPGDELASAELRAAVLAAIHRLPRCQSVAMLLRAMEELPYDEIAAAMDCSPATARKHVARGTARLRLMLARWQPTPPTRSSP
jgi:RNA polymerase sigma-70 factor (ECF subfamily)